MKAIAIKFDNSWPVFLTLLHPNLATFIIYDEGIIDEIGISDDSPEFVAFKPFWISKSFRQERKEIKQSASFQH
ncbi:MAG: hypothetical protein EAZ32_12165 [Cytophagia bacterium]|nr:MAG: hypothetical protein EAZ46_06855 [Runella sp.]TAG19260.1 MAG: hypothetical protein EAZ38_12805 [Cytophagales bacterium]TAG38514.1 MAG: hypothetical protein EAZ32_12165 [Cytophagia bacterium]TAG80131.1 MAG: hypothetical protein EAZ22_10235 [Cytophagales bacterium]